MTLFRQIALTCGLVLLTVVTTATDKPNIIIFYVSVKNTGPAIKKAYIIYRRLGEKSKHRSREYVSKPDDAKLTGMRELAQIGKDGFSVSASIPEGIPAFCFSVIDANGYRQYSDVVEVK